MNQYLYLIPALPLLGFLVLALGGRALSKNTVAWVGAGTVSAAATIAIITAVQFLQTPPAGDAYTQTLWQWMSTENLSIAISLRVDALSMVFVFIPKSRIFWKVAVLLSCVRRLGKCGRFGARPVKMSTNTLSFS